MKDFPDYPESDEERLRAISTRGLGDTDFEEAEPKWGTARFGSRTDLIIFVRDANERFVFDAGTVDELVLGRFDPLRASDYGVHPFWLPAQRLLWRSIEQRSPGGLAAR